MSFEDFENKKDKNKQHIKELESLGLFPGEIKDLGNLLKDKILANKGEFSEDLTIRERGYLECENPDGSLTSLFAHLAGNPENIYLLAKKIQEEFPELEFNFERDKHGKKIKYTVKEKKISNK